MFNLPFSDCAARWHNKAAEKSNLQHVAFLITAESLSLWHMILERIQLKHHIQENVRGN